MSDFNAFTKIWALGHRNIISIWDYDVEVTEKIDGSQFGVTNTSNGLVVRSKGVVIDQDNVPNLFSPVVEYFQSIQHKLPIGIKFYGETLNKPYLLNSQRPCPVLRNGGVNACNHNVSCKCVLTTVVA